MTDGHLDHALVVTWALHSTRHRADTALLYS